MPHKNVFVLLIALVAGALSYAARDHGGYGRRFGELLTTVERTYIEPVESRALFESAIAGILSKLDENSSYVRPAQRAEFEASLDLEFGGIGLELDAGGRHPVVQGLMPASPAWRAGLAPGDTILAIDGRTTRAASLADTVAKLRGRPGSGVVLTVAGAGTDASETAVRDVTLVRETIRIESVLGDRRRADGRWEWRIEGRPELAHLRITSFGEHTRGDFEKAIEEIVAGGPLEAVVLDLRGNPGGLVSSAVEVCDLLLDAPAVIVSTRNRRDSDRDTTGESALDRRMATAGALLDGIPMAVLIDDDTASAAEIVAASLQDHGRATVMGSRSFGKGTVQQVLPLIHDDGLLKITTSEYLRPSGGRIQRRSDDAGDESWGVAPDSGFEIVLTRESRTRLDAWRRDRDAVRRRTDGPAREDAVDAGSLADGPEQLDPVLGRAVSWLTDGGREAPSPGKNSLPRR